MSAKNLERRRFSQVQWIMVGMVIVGGGGGDVLQVKVVQKTSTI